MGKLNLDGRVAVVTGSGRGIGRGYALLLSELGAKVVVNDNGGATSGIGSDAGPATDVANEIAAAGGTAVPNTNDISTEEGGKGLIDQAVSEFGRIDIVVNNAGNVLWGALPDVGADAIEGQVKVHTMGTFYVTRAAWPYMLEQDYGRVVLTGSVGMFGLTDNLGYANVKAGMIGMAKSMTVGAGQANIKVNVICPNAWTRLGVHPSEEMQGMQREAPPNMGTELVAPMVAWMCHETCDVSGEAFVAGAGRFARLFVGVTDGYVHGADTGPTIDDVADNIAKISDESSYYVPATLMDWAGHYMAHLAS
jgi:NAD(P)-dependent dehydrogenase (short-subunit alcohol dehydrogenase family)